MDSTFDFPQHDGEKRQPNPTLHSEKVRANRKTFFLDLKENFRGKFVKITEDVGGRRDTILVPMEAFEDFADAVESMRDFAAGLGD